jgi:single-stranded-DNA-specific exonuclease
LIQFGGHTFAAGMTLKETQLESFRKKFEEVVSSKLIPEQMIPQILIDAKIPLAQLNEKFVRILSQMSPFGPENMTPVFMSDNVWLRTKPRIMKERHLKIEVYQEGSPVFEAVGFGMVEEYHEALLQERSFSICYTVGINEWNGRSTIQLILKDILVE